MASLNETFDINDLPQGNSNYEPLPAGWYDVTITQAEIKDTKSGTGQMIRVRYDVAGPTHQGRVVFGNFNIKNANPKAEEIGRQQLGDLMRSIGVPKVTDTDQLIGGQLKIKLDIRTQEGYDPSNDVRAFKALEGSVPPMKSSVTSAPAASSGKTSSPPWAKK